MIIHQNTAAINEGFIKNLVHRVKDSIRIDKEVKAVKPDCLKAIDGSENFIESILTKLEAESKELEKYLRDAASSKEFSEERFKNYVAARDKINDKCNADLKSGAVSDIAFISSERFENGYFGDSKVAKKYDAFAKNNFRKYIDRCNKLDSECATLSDLLGKVYKLDNYPNNYKIWVADECKSLGIDIIQMIKVIIKVFNIYIKCTKIQIDHESNILVDSGLKFVLEAYNPEFIEL